MHTVLLPSLHPHIHICQPPISTKLLPPSCQCTPPAATPQLATRRPQELTSTAPPSASASLSPSRTPCASQGQGPRPRQLEGSRPTRHGRRKDRNHDTAARSQPVSISPSNGKRDAAFSGSSKPSLLSHQPQRRQRPACLDADWIPGQHPHPQPSAPHTPIKPSSMGNGIIGPLARVRHLAYQPQDERLCCHAPPLAPLFVTRQDAVNGASHPPPSPPHRAQRRLALFPHLFHTTSTCSKYTKRSAPLPSHKQAGRRRSKRQLDADTHQLASSIPSTPNRPREASTERSLGASNQPAEVAKASNLRTPLFIKGPVEQLQASSSDLARTPSPSQGHGFGRHETGFTGTSLFNRGPSVNVQSSPKRSPLVLANIPLRQGAGNGATNPALLSPTTSPKLTHRTLSPMTRHPPRHR
ncbi:hypothetical protein L1887_61001 [Cichorium endivia]|nr:hypothetical protein L1887_61001 [Cichorium endivia]